jgi:hypothetical protein
MPQPDQRTYGTPRPQYDLAYVAGPYTAPDALGREQNVRRAEGVATQLMLLRPNWGSVCVHSMSRYWHGRVPESVAITWGLELLRRCDAVVLVDGWERSRGTHTEIVEAARLGIPIYESIDAWLEQDYSVLVELKARFR